MWNRAILLAAIPCVLCRHNVTVDDQDPAIIYRPKASWSPSANSPLDVRGAHMLTDNPAATATFHFKGVAVYFVSPLWPYHVTTAVSLDSGPVSLLDLVDQSRRETDGGPETVQSRVVWSSGELANTQHTLVISVGKGEPYAIVDAIVYTVLDPGGDGDDNTSSSSISSLATFSRPQAITTSSSTPAITTSSRTPAITTSSRTPAIITLSSTSALFSFRSDSSSTSRSSSSSSSSPSFSSSFSSSSSSGSGSAAAATKSASADASKSTHAVPIALGTVFGVLALLLILLGIWFFIRRKRRPVSEAWTVPGTLRPFHPPVAGANVPLIGSEHASAGMDQYYDNNWEGGATSGLVPGAMSPVVAAAYAQPYGNATSVTEQPSNEGTIAQIAQSYMRSPNRHQPTTLSTITETLPQGSSLANSSGSYTRDLSTDSVGVNATPQNRELLSPVFESTGPPPYSP
ncbi:hypothetical protein C0993_005931 [Termitomyces sp. T159_Od127]|nr:hypothetical protein C0993_005931 [Termitomyces sp. T159_Od127]